MNARYRVVKEKDGTHSIETLFPSLNRWSKQWFDCTEEVALDKLTHLACSEELDVFVGTDPECPVRAIAMEAG